MKKKTSKSMMGILQLTILIRSARACSTIITAVMWRVLKIPDTTARAGGEHLDSGQSGTRNPKSGFEFPLPLGFICVTALKRQNCASCAEMFVLICDVPLFGYIIIYAHVLSWAEGAGVICGHAQFVSFSTTVCRRRDQPWPSYRRHQRFS